MTNEEEKKKMKADPDFVKAQIYINYSQHSYLRDKVADIYRHHRVHVTQSELVRISIDRAIEEESKNGNVFWSTNRDVSNLQSSNNKTDSMESARGGDMSQTMEPRKGRKRRL